MRTRRQDGGATVVAERLQALAREALVREDYCYSSVNLSDAERAGAPIYGCLRRFYERVAGGEEPEVVFAEEDRKWRGYAQENNARYDAAPKADAGVRVHHVSPDRFRDAYWADAFRAVERARGGRA